MSTFDIFLALPILYGAFQGFRKGLLLELISLFALVFALLMGIKLLDTALPVIRGFVGDAGVLLPFITFLIVFIGIVLGVRVLGLLLKKVLDFTPFGFFDNLLGGILGALKWCIGLSLLLYVADMAGITITEETAAGSVIYPVVLKTTPYALNLLGYVLPFVKSLFESFKKQF
ncbi:CvpA family protein [Pontibacter sp. SGAir0037]|uniref:CvpA family protein n=1 Tax=Pontibacter sp. SGAir0037 TaxID=2571030 RepID=UPI0010CCD3A6|nr:CvpA family protein [Pontibacter sp. SGAir0037]QCR24289.1 colicin v production protein [Pontibacter sp. SGAir0037]